VAEPAFAIGELIKLVFALGLTIGLFYALALFMKRMQVGTGKSGTLITVLAALPLGGKEKIWVLDIAGEKLVVGTSPGNVNCLHVLSKTEMLEQAVLVTPKPAAMTDFAALLKSVGNRCQSQIDSDTDLGTRPGFAEVLGKFRGSQKP
jgi:flagellar biosynthetic protein FliO